MIHLSETNLNNLDNNANGNEGNMFEMRYNQENGNLYRKGKPFLGNEGNVSEDFDSGAVIVRSSSKQNRASPATDPYYGHNGGSKDQPLNGDSNIEAGCEILCLKYLSCLEGSSSKSQGTPYLLIHIVFKREK